MSGESFLRPAATRRAFVAGAFSTLAAAGLGGCVSVRLDAGAPTAPAVATATPVTRPPQETQTQTAVMKGFDTDFGRAGLQSQRWFDDRKAEGYEWFWTTGHTYWNARAEVWDDGRTAIDRALSAGLMVAAYGRPVSRWREAIGCFGSLNQHLQFFALDVEHEDDGRHHQVTREMVEGVRGMGVRPVIYTGRHMWDDIMRGSTEFADVPLLDYAGNISGWPSGLSNPGFGGWSQRVGQQLRHNVVRDGVVIDEAVLDRSFATLAAA